jgi:glycerol-3-phosphate dehydrogenase (NAD(P)+)
LMSNGIGDENSSRRSIKWSNINDSAYFDLLVTGYCFFQKQDVWKYDWEGYNQKRHDGNEHGFWRYYEKRLQTKSGYGAKTPIIDAVYEILYEGKMQEPFKKLTDKLIKQDFLFF